MLLKPTFLILIQESNMFPLKVRNMFCPHVNFLVLLLSLQNEHYIVNVAQTHVFFILIHESNIFPLRVRNMFCPHVHFLVLLLSLQNEKILMKLSFIAFIAFIACAGAAAALACFIAFMLLTVFMAFIAGAGAGVGGQTSQPMCLLMSFKQVNRCVYQN